MDLVSHATRTYTTSIRREQITDLKTMGSIPRVVEDIRAHLYHLGGETSNPRDLGSSSSS